MLIHTKLLRSELQNKMEAILVNLNYSRFNYEPNLNK